MKQLPPLLQGLENPVFARLYLAQTINLVGDAFTWLGLALLAFELAGENASTVLAGTLTLRVMAFVVLSPLAGAIADRVDRKQLMITTHLARMVIVCFLPFVTQIWQIYVIVLFLNVFYAFFAPTYTATIPLVTTEIERPKAIALSSATYQLLGVLGPGLAGGIAAFVGTRKVFFLDGITFLIVAILMVMLPEKLVVNQSQQKIRTVSGTLADIGIGIKCLFVDPLIRYALALQLVASIAGAEILINTVSYIQGTLHLSKIEYGWVMAAFGMGATLAAIGLGNTKQKVSPVILTSIGAMLITLALLPANSANLAGLLALWVIAGAGQTLVNVPTQALIADRVVVEAQGRVYGAHFAWSHLWWAFSYPLAGLLGQQLPTHNFFFSGLAGLALLLLISLALNPQKLMKAKNGLWHQHSHSSNDKHHTHEHSLSIDDPHNHLHFHPKSARL